MSVATRRASLTPSSPAGSRRSSWVDLPAVNNASSSRRGSRVDLSVHIHPSSTSTDSYAAVSSPKLAIHQLLTNLSHLSESRPSNMSSPMPTPTGAQLHSAKRKHDADLDASSSTAFKMASPAEIHLPTDPTRRASIINLATAAAAAVLQSQAGQRRMSTHPEQEQKRQRVEQLGMLIEQARKASVTSMSHDMSRHIETASQNVAIATVLANHLGLTPQSPAPSSSTPSAPPYTPGSPTKAHASTLSVPQTPSTPKSPLSAAPFTAAHPSRDFDTSSETADITKEGAPQQMAAPPSPTSTPSITLNNSTESLASLPSSKVLVAEPLRESPPATTGAMLHEQAKEAASTYSRFYRFEKEWAQKALDLERRRSSVRIDPFFNPNPSLSPLPMDSKNDKAQASSSSSPQLHSAPESRIMSRGTSPFAESATGSASRSSHSLASTSFSSSHRASSSGLANVLSNFAELIEHRQRSCSGLEALAKQAKELPVKRLSQPNPQFRTTFGDFSWSKARSATDPTPASSRFAPASNTRALMEGEGEPDTSSEIERVNSAKASAQSSHLQVKSKPEKKIKAEVSEAEGDAPATPRSSMSIASML